MILVPIGGVIVIAVFALVALAIIVVAAIGMWVTAEEPGAKDPIIEEWEERMRERFPGWQPKDQYYAKTRVLD